MRVFFSLGIVKGSVAGLIGTGAGMGIAVLVRFLAGVPVWNQGIVYTVGITFGLFAFLGGVGVFNSWFRWIIGSPPKSESSSSPSWARYFSLNTNHKVIGIQYLVTALVFLPFAVSLQLVGRLHMTKLVLGATIISPETYESVISDHGIVMLFIVVLPAVAGLMNYLVPIMIGAKDMAFPKLNAASYWLVPVAGLLSAFSLLAGGFDTGWTVYPPLAASFEPLGMNLVLMGIFIGGFSSILTAVNVLATVFTMRAPGMGLFRMPIFVWGAIATTILSLVFTQFLAISFMMILLERVVGMGFFVPEMGGAPLLYQFLFWFYSHPAVYVFVLPGLAIISEIIPVFTRKPLFGYRAVAISALGIAVGGMFVFAHHMFVSGMPAFLRIPFMITTLLVAVPTGVKIFSWVATMWRGKIWLAPPLLFVLTSIILFLIGGITGIPLGIVPTDMFLHDTYFVVAHFHAMLFGGFLLPLMAGIYYWFPKVTGRMLDGKQGFWQWLLMTIGSGLLILPMFGLGLEGMRRRVADYSLPEMQPLHIATAVGGFLIFAGLVVLAYNIVRSMKRGQVAGSNPWGAHSLVWLISSPPPEDNFEEIPEVVGSPYMYGVPGGVHARLKTKKSESESKSGPGG